MTPSRKPLMTYLTEYAGEFPDKKFLGDANGWLTVEQALEQAQRCAGRLEELGVREGELVALRAYRTAETILVLLSLQLLGAVAVLTEPRSEVEPFLDRCAVPVPVKCILERKEEGFVLRRPGTAEGQALSGLFASGPRLTVPASRDSREPGFLIFTSGSTGKSKAVMLSQYNLINNLVDSHPLGYYDETDVALGALPLDHVFGLVLLCGCAVLRYALYLPEKTDIPSILDTIEAEGITRMNGVPSLYLAMAEQKGERKLSSLRAGFIGGGPCTPEQFCRIEGELGMTLIPVYGMSECIGVACASYTDPQAVRAAGVGPFYSMNTGVILLEDGTPAPVGTEGEICVDGPARMVGYYGDSAPRTPYFHTGDLGFLDENGVLHISGRKKEIIIRNGVNLSPVRIEQALLSLPGVTAAAVVGLPDEKSGELPWAMVVGTGGTQEAWRQALAPLLTKNELPAGILCVEALPMTPSGKPDKQRIREVLKQWSRS